MALAVSPLHAKKMDGGAEQLNQYVEARLAEGDGQPNIAATIYQNALKEQPSNILVASKAYVKAIETGNWPLAVKAVRSIEENGRLDPEMPLILFVDAYKRRDWKATEVALAEIESLKNFSFLVPIFNNWISIAKGDVDQVDYTDIANNKTGLYYLEDHQILSLLARGQDAQALTAINEAVKRNDIRMAPIRVIAARHFIAKKNLDAARSILALKRTSPELRLLKKIDDGTIDKLGQKVTAGVGASFTFQRLSSDLGLQRAQFLALVLAQSASNISTPTDTARLTLGRAYLSAEYGENARKSLEKIEPDSPYFLIALNAEIGSYLNDKLYKEAFARLASVTESNPEMPELQVLMGQVHQNQGDHGQAALAYTKAIELAEKSNYSEPMLANYYLALGSAQEQADIWPGGLQSLEKANSLLPNSASILNYLGYAQLERRVNTDAAIKAIQTAHELRSSSPAITDSLGWAYFLVGKHDRAVEYLEKALEGEPQDPTINEHLGDAYWTVGRKYEARYAWSSAKLFAENEALKRLSDKIDLGLVPDLVSP